MYHYNSNRMDIFKLFNHEIGVDNGMGGHYTRYIRFDIIRS